ncbi:ATP-binding cassette domain-containing protein [Spiroplasma diminutum]|uniref:ABC transporter ATP-binding protein n=1 Tax=Spiroplasma diminutum CUAS-1 TaxID=1276221 RepID=S5LZP3_9MOLU|nr:ATP-binding cassette domain-containing protein [Spiroplasma diminutum]AGR42071.1 ABC transporter ATP-binding protein [Spiroplasma diminutum CUAS-1]
MIEFIKVTKMFTQNKGLKDVNIKINNETIGIIGPNGSGKTTFIELLLGFFKPDKGEIKIKDVLSNSFNFNLKDIAYVSANTNLPLEISIKDYIKYIKTLENSENFNKELEKLANIFIFDIEDKTTIGSLSSGMIQKLKIIISTASDKDIYIFDEPTRGLDPIAIDIFSKIIRKIKSRNKTIIYCSHIIDEIEQNCNRAIIIKDNIIVKDINLSNKNINLKDEFKSFYNYQDLEDY